jgi:hypothetical protein
LQGKYNEYSEVIKTVKYKMEWAESKYIQRDTLYEGREESKESKERECSANRKWAAAAGTVDSGLSI